MDVAVLNLDLGNVKRDLLYRRGTGDEVEIVQALKNSACNFGRLRQGKALSDLYERLIGAGKTPLIIDAGAGIGASAIYFACAYPKARVVAVELEPGSFELLSRNTAGLPVECLRGVVAAPVSAAAPGDRLTPAHDVTPVALGDIFEKHSQDTLPFVVKLDIEHISRDLLVANDEWIDRTPVVVVKLRDCLIPGTANVRALVEFLAGRNRDFVYLHDNIFSIDRGAIAP